MEIVFFVRRKNTPEPSFVVSLSQRRAKIVAVILLGLIIGGIYWGAKYLGAYWLETRAPIALSLVSDMENRLERQQEKKWEIQVDVLSEQISLLRARIIELQLKGGIVAKRAGIADDSFFDVASAECKKYFAPQDNNAFTAAIKKEFPPIDSAETLSHHLPSIQCYEQTLAATERKYDIMMEHGAQSFVRYDTVPIQRPILGRNWWSSRFGMRRDPITGRRAFHGGYDYAARRGTPIVAAATGVVTYAGRLGNYGNAVRISHGDSISTLYGHMRNIDVKVGQYVERGQKIGGVGNTGRSTGPHLHYEVRVKNRPRPIASEIRKIREARGVPEEWKS